MFGDRAVDHATEHHIADECQRHAWGHDSARSLVAIRFRRVGNGWAPAGPRASPLRVHTARAASAYGHRLLLAAPSLHEIAERVERCLQTLLDRVGVGLRF